MLKGPVLHPPLLAGIAAVGHGAQILVADANYPASTAARSGAPVIHLNLAPGVVDAVTVLTAIASLVPIEQVTVMAPNREGPYAMSGDPEIWAEYRVVLADAEGAPVDTVALDRWAFYEEARGRDVGLVVTTGETRLYANLLLRVGVVRAHDERPTGRVDSSTA